MPYLFDNGDLRKDTHHDDLRLTSENVEKLRDKITKIVQPVAVLQYQVLGPVGGSPLVVQVSFQPGQLSWIAKEFALDVKADLIGTVSDYAPKDGGLTR